MKKAFIFLSLCLVLVCCKKEMTFEDMTREQMDDTFNEISKGKCELSNERVVWSTDSLCIIHVDYKGRNMYGGEVESRMEYLLYQGKNGINEYYSSISEGKGFLEYCNSIERQEGGTIKDPKMNAAFYAILCISFSDNKREIKDRRKN